ncbi:MAG: class I SAM-dependent methyltransferase [Patescibacteria group bacterium]|nr:class I SAM-dependent methyltransferase [Patescibacteria group bacterium]
MDDLITKLVDLLSRHNFKNNQTEKEYWERFWLGQKDYFIKNKEILEINDPWDFNCNLALHNHYKSIIKNIKNKSFLECGTGSGFESCLISKDGGNVSIIDYTNASINYAKIVASRTGQNVKMKFILKDFLQYKPKEKFDVVWNCGVIEHYDEKNAVILIKKMKYLTKSGGRVLITIPNLLSPQSLYWSIFFGKGSEKYFSHRSLKRTMEQAGLTNVKITNFHYWLPSFFPYTWAIKTSQVKLINNQKILTWLFTGVGYVN